MIEDASFYDRALRRMSRAALWLAAIATACVAIRFGWVDALGCAAGAAVSLLNLHWWKRLAAALGEGGPPSRHASAVFLGLRYVLLGGVCFVIIRFFGVRDLALMAGLLIPVAAVLVEIAYELVVYH